MLNEPLGLKTKALSRLVHYRTPLLIFVIIVFSLTLYFPALSVEYGIYDDYTLLANDAENPWDFFLVKIILRRGRVAGAALFLWFSLILKQIADLVLLRWASFICLLMFLGLLARFLKKECGLEHFWILIASMAILMLPASQVSILRTTLIMSIGAPLVLSAISYYLLYYTLRQDKKTASAGFKWKLPAALIISQFLFVLSIFIYQTTAFSVWIFTFALVLFRPHASWINTRKVVVRDLLFFGCGTLIYRLLNQMVVIPMARTFYKYDHFGIVDGSEIYTMNLTKDPLAKLQLLWVHFVESAAGSWHVIFAEQGALIFYFLLSLGSIALGKRFVVSHRNSLPSDPSSGLYIPVKFGIEKIMSIVLLISAVNLPSMLGAGVDSVQGFRTLVSISFMLILMQIWSLRYFRITFTGSTGKMLLNGIVCAWLLTISVVSGQHIRDVVTHYHHELKILRTAMHQYDLDRWNRIIIIKTNRSRSFVGRSFEHEFGNGISQTDNVLPFFLEKYDLKTYRERNVDLLVTRPGWVGDIDLQEKDYLIDLDRDAYLKKREFWRTNKI